MKRIIFELQALIRRIVPAEKRSLVMLALAACAIYIFAEIASEVFEGETQSFDEAILLAFRDPLNIANPIGPRWLEEMMRDFTALGSVGVLTIMSLSVIIYFILERKRHAAMLLGLSVVGGAIVSQLLKSGFARPRPDLVPHGAYVYTQSFPSGHAMLSAVVFLTLGALLARSHANVKIKIYFLSVAAFLTVIVGISRIYLGVHWPTDVLAGWVIGIAWASLCWLIMLWLQSHGKVEVESESEQFISSRK